LPDYFPRHGSDGYRVEHYDLALNHRVGPNRLTGDATVTAVASRPLKRVSLDLGAFRVAGVRVDGRAAKYSHRAGKLEVTPGRTIPAGERFTVSVRYGGNPRSVTSPYGELGWEQLTDGSLVAGQPTGAPSWFPCNDRPDRKARFRISVTTSSLYHVVANGRLAGRTSSGASTTWEYVQDEPMATYLAAVQIGRYTTTELPGPVPQLLVHPARLERAVREVFARQTAMMEVFTERFGPYPFGSYTAVITDDELEIPVEAQGMSTFGANHADRSGERLIAHELAHQWFGNSLTLGDWRDIWLHEGFAAYAEWIWSEASGGEPADALARRWHRRLSAQPQELRIGDPGVRALFDDRVYKRGALTLHALRLTVGDERFFALLREWTATHRHGTVDTAAFTALTGQESLLRKWLFDGKLPALPSS
jgi:aminopeptidase N